MEIGRTSGVFDEHTINTKIRQIKKAEGTHRSPPLFLLCSCLGYLVKPVSDSPHVLYVFRI